MQVVEPTPITTGVLTSTNVVDIEAAWVAGTYNKGTRRVYDRRVYEVVADPNTDDRPDIGAAADPPTWVLLGYSNTWRMFTEGFDSRSTATGEIDVTLTFGATTSQVGVFGILANSLRVIVTDPTDGVVYDEERDLADIGVADWWEFFFLSYDTIDTAIFSLPPYPDASIRIHAKNIDLIGEVAIGRVVAGISRNVGVTLYGTSVETRDYSIKERDGFGNLRLIPRRVLLTVNYAVHVPTQNIDRALRIFRGLSNTPSLFIGDPGIVSTVVFGVITNVSQGITYPSVSELNLQVEEF